MPVIAPSVYHDGGIGGSVNKIRLSEQLGELRDYPRDVVAKFNQSWNDRLNWPPTKISERYLRNKLAIALKLKCNLRGSQFGMCAFIAFNKGFVLSRQLSSAARKAHHQFSVLIDNVEVMKDRQKIVSRVGGLVWLEFQNQLACLGLGDSLYFSIKTGDTIFIDRLFIADRKHNAFTFGRVFPVTPERKVPSDMIETRTKVVNNFPGKHRKSWWDTTLLMVMDCLKRNLSLVLWNNGVSATLDKQAKLPVKIADVLVGPF